MTACFYEGKPPMPFVWGVSMIARRIMLANVGTSWIQLDNSALICFCPVHCSLFAKIRIPTSQQTPKNKNTGGAHLPSENTRNPRAEPRTAPVSCAARIGQQSGPPPRAAPGGPRLFGQLRRSSQHRGYIHNFPRETIIREIKLKYYIPYFS